MYTKAELHSRFDEENNTYTRYEEENDFEPHRTETNRRGYERRATGKSTGTHSLSEHDDQKTLTSLFTDTFTFIYSVSYIIQL